MRVAYTIALVLAISLSAHAHGLRPVAPQAPVANAGLDRTVNVNEVTTLDGSASTGWFDGVQADGRYSIRWDFGYGGFTWEGGPIAPIAYPLAGIYTATLTVCNSGGTCATDTATVTVTNIAEGAVTIVGDTGNPVTNGTNLCNAFTTLAAANNPVVEVTAGVVYRRPPSSACILPARTGSGYLTVRSSALASLPNGLTRVFPADAANMAILETGVHSSNPALNSSEAIFRAVTTEGGGTSASGYRFVGLHVRKTFPTLDYVNPRGFFDFGAGSPTSLSHLPSRIQVDRCYFDGGSATTGSTTRGVVISATDVAVVNSYFHRIQGPGIEVQAVWIGMGERINLMNNFMQATTEVVMSGGSDVSIRVTEGTAQSAASTTIVLAAGASSVDDFYNGKGIYIQSGTGACCVGPAPGTYGRVITDYVGATRTATVDPAFTVTPDSTSVYRIGDHVPTDVVIRRNEMSKDLGWYSGSGTYYGVNHSVKNIFESKQGLRWSIQGNYFHDHWMEDQNWAIVLTAKNQDGRQPWSRLSYYDFSHNKIYRVGNCFQILTSDWGAATPSSDHILIRQTVCSGVSYYEDIALPGTGGFRNYAVLQDSGTTGAQTTIGDRVSFVQNSNDAEGTDGKGRMFQFETTTRWRNFTVYGNIGQGYFTQNGPTGEAAIIAGTGGGAGSFSMTKNGFYRIDGTLPVDNTTVSTRADVGFTDVSAHNLKLTGSSPFLTTGPAGGRAGADTDAVDTLTSGTVSGVWADTVTIYTANLQRGRSTDGTDGSTSRSRQVTALANADIALVQERITGDTGWNAPLAAAGFAEAVYRENDPNQADGPAIWYKTATVTVNATFQTDLQTTNLIGWNGTTTVNKAAVGASVTVAGRQFYVFSTHLCWSACNDSSSVTTSAQREGQIATLLTWVNTVTGGSPNVIIGGDMNFAPNTPKISGGFQKDLFTAAGYTDLWNAGITAGTATANWGDRNVDSVADMPVGDLTTRTHDTRRIDYFFIKQGATLLSMIGIDLPDQRAVCPHALVTGGTFPSCSPEVSGGPAVSGQQWDIPEDFGVRPSDHNFVAVTVELTGVPAVPTHRGRTKGKVKVRGKTRIP